MKNPTELRNITAQMKYWLNAMCEERAETLEAWNDVKFYEDNFWLSGAKKALARHTKIYNERRNDLLACYDCYQKLNKKRKALIQPKKVKQLSFQL